MRKPMKIVVSHHSLNLAGGGENVCLKLIGILCKRGNDVTLATVDMVDWDFINKLFDEEIISLKEFHLIRNLPNINFTFLFDSIILMLYFLKLLFLKLTTKGLLISTCGEKISSVADIIYVNGLPLRCAFRLPSTSIRKKCYSILYHIFLKFIDKINPSIIIANSKFSGEIIEKCLKRRAIIIHPPVNTKRFFMAGKNARRKNIVVTTTRFLPNQNLDYVLKVASIVKEAKFLVFGVSPKYSSTLERLKKLTLKMDVGDRVRIMVNQPFSRFLRALSEAKVFFRTVPFETFGISIVEAMAAGCVPVVPRNGGPWIDILDRKNGLYGFSYRSVDEAANIINMLLKNEDLRSKISFRARLRALDFDQSVFERKILMVVNKVYRKIGDLM